MKVLVLGMFLAVSAGADSFKYRCAKDKIEVWSVGSEISLSGSVQIKDNRLVSIEGKLGGITEYKGYTFRTRAPNHTTPRNNEFSYSELVNSNKVIQYPNAASYPKAASYPSDTVVKMTEIPHASSYPVSAYYDGGNTKTGTYDINFKATLDDQSKIVSLVGDKNNTPIKFNKTADLKDPIVAQVFDMVARNAGIYVLSALCCANVKIKECSHLTRE